MQTELGKRQQTVIIAESYYEDILITVNLVAIYTLFIQRNFLFLLPHCLKHYNVLKQTQRTSGIPFESFKAIKPVSLTHSAKNSVCPQFAVTQCFSYLENSSRKIHDRTTKVDKNITSN